MKNPNITTEDYLLRVLKKHQCPKCPYCKEKLTLVLKGKQSGKIYICYKCDKLIYEEELEEK